MNTTNCSKEIPYLATVEFLESGCHIGSVLMLSLSSYTLYLIATKTPAAMKTSVPYMINLHVWTMFCDFTWAVLVLPMFFMPVIAAHSSGIILWVTHNPSVVLWFPFASLGGMAAAIISLFEHRHRVIVTDSKFVLKNKHFRNFLFTVVYLGSINFGFPEILTAPDDQEGAKRRVFEKYPCFQQIFKDNNTYVIQEDASLFNPHMYLTCLYLAVVMGFLCLHVLWHLLPRNNPSMSSATRKMLVSFFISMCIQVGIPVFVIYLPNLYWNISITFELYSQELNNISIVLFTLHGTSSSVATIFIYAPYRKYTKDLVLEKNCARLRINSPVIIVPKFLRRLIGNCFQTGLHFQKEPAKWIAFRYTTSSAAAAATVSTSDGFSPGKHCSENPPVGIASVCKKAAGKKALNIGDWSSSRPIRRRVSAQQDQSGLCDFH